MVSIDNKLKKITMKKYHLFLISILSLSLIFACSDEEESQGQPQLTVSGVPSTAYFGDSLSFSAEVSDLENVPLSTLKARLFFGDDLVSETVIRTKSAGNYSGQLYIPFLPNIPDGTATLELVAQNIEFATEIQKWELPVSRPDFPHLTLVTAEGEFTMEKTGPNQYAATENFPQKVKAVIKAPAFGDRGNDITFGWREGAVQHHSDTQIPFSNSNAGVYAISFNTLNYQAAPFIVLRMAGTEMAMVDDNNYKIEKELEQDAAISIEGFSDLDDWWIDPDFMEANEDGTFAFVPSSGKYRVTANFEHKYFIFEVMSGNDLATLQADGSGALWIIGEDIGKPSLANTTGWNPGKAICFAPVAPKIYQVTLVGGQNINTSSINFKFFHQKNWGGEYTNNSLTTESDLIFVGDGENGRDPGNLGLAEGVTLETGKTYILKVDITAGRDNAVLTVTAE
ncbi:hypothetical protein JCM15548_11913 [Geofilum rubicundum JCM 15548]|uniref:DUF5125 domain-containing protein n=2 Tax=Geofilum TaxID=1236988 RepID=A0A0E9LWR2_9BACT|nr:hypothetical protein JCM15548_11913 [Geofilum rubicundum JCM 15548]